MIPCFRPTANIKETLAFLLDVVKTPQQSREAVKEFEKQFCIYQNCSHSIFVPSGRMALWLILKAFDYPQGSEIILPAFTFFAIPALIKHLGLIPVYADVDNNTYVLSAKSVQKVISPKTKAVIPTHLFGRTCEMDQLQKICKDNNIDIIEDCAQALGAEIGDTKAGNIGRAAYFTFGITKNFTTFSGGMVICQEETIFKQMQELIAEFHAPQKSALFKQGITALAMRIATSRPVFNISLNPILRLASGEKPDIIHRMFEETPHPIDAEKIQQLKWRPVDAQARAGLRQLKELERKNQARRDSGAEMIRLLKVNQSENIPDPAPANGDHIFMSFAIRRKNRYRFTQLLRRFGIDVSLGYMSNCAMLNKDAGNSSTCPNATSSAKEILHIPLYPELKTKDIKRVVEAIRKADGQPEY